MIGEDDGPVALGNASHRHMKDTMRSLDVMLLQTEINNQLNFSKEEKKILIYHLLVLNCSQGQKGSRSQSQQPLG